jgi:hypothetical protein
VQGLASALQFGRDRLTLFQGTHVALVFVIRSIKGTTAPYRIE